MFVPFQTISDCYTKVFNTLYFFFQGQSLLNYMQHGSFKSVSSQFASCYICQHGTSVHFLAHCPIFNRLLKFCLILNAKLLDAKHRHQQGDVFPHQNQSRCHICMRSTTKDQELCQIRFTIVYNSLLLSNA